MKSEILGLLERGERVPAIASSLGTRSPNTSKFASTPGPRHCLTVSSPRRGEIDSLLASGMRLQEVARATGIPYHWVRWYAPKSGIEYPGKNVTGEQRAEILRRRLIDGDSIRQIAHDMNLSKTAVGRICKQEFRRVADEGGTEVKPERLREPKRCPIHGLVYLWPCVACAAAQRIHSSNE